MANNVEEIRLKRFQFLNKLYEETGGNELASVNFLQLRERLGFSLRLIS
jgi:hypothetical protein